MRYHNVPVISNLFQQTDQFPFADLHFWNDPDCQCQAIIAIHSTAAGPALGGCRMYPYASTENALFDVLNLAQGMSYKAAINHLPLGGGKSVIIHPGIIKDRQALMGSFGRFVNSLGGRYITAVDVGTNTNDMDYISHFTQHVTCTSKPCTSTQNCGSGDPSPSTAKGVFRGIQAVSKFLFKTTQLNDRHIVIQGLGHVGYEVAKLLYNAGARLTVSDTNKAAIKRCVEDFSAQAVTPEAVYGIESDIFSPCALGQVINSRTINNLKTKAVAGAANNQLLDNQQGEILRQKNILYAPDYVINSGGLIQIACFDKEQLNKKIDALYDLLLDIFQKSQKQQLATNIIANQIAQQILKETERANFKADCEQMEKIEA